MKTRMYSQLEKKLHRGGVAVSVIIPAHNAEGTLRRAVESVLAAMEEVASDAVLSARGAGEEPFYEVIVVENTSEDGTVALALCLQKEHPGTVRFFQSEKGVSCARNKGLDQARGEWILFVDADDYLLEDAGKVLRDDLHFSATDLILHSYDAGGRTVHVCGKAGERYAGERVVRAGKGPGGEADGGGKASVASGPGGGKKGQAMGEVVGSGTAGSGAAPLEALAVRMIENPTRYTSVWSKLFKRERIEYMRLRFDPALRLSEDSHFVIRYLAACRRARLVDRPFYHYSTDNASAVRSWDGTKEEGYRRSLLAVRDYLQTRPLPVREAFAGYGMMQFNLLMVREVFSARGLPAGRAEAEALRRAAADRMLEADGEVPDAGDLAGAEALRRPPRTLAEKIRAMRRISGEEPFASAIAAYDPRRHRGARYLPIALIRRGLYPAAAAIYEARVLQNARKERMH